MPRPARIVLPNIAHHVVQRGNRRQRLFFDDGDRLAYLKLLTAALERHGTSCLGWCLMDNHIHLILLPLSADGLRAPLASAHTAYAQRVNRTRELSGHLFQGRFASYAMDDAHLMVAARYVENNPVVAGAVGRAESWPWSSARRWEGTYRIGGRCWREGSKPATKRSGSSARFVRAGRWAARLGAGLSPQPTDSRSIRPSAAVHVALAESKNRDSPYLPKMGTVPVLESKPALGRRSTPCSSARPCRGRCS